ncbi:MAG: outer membrane protein assembly factor BamD [Acetobacteraceae bacterium]|nr:outer membrane protein assembly factor BamD [Acetobacteraceae bacterium]
MTDRHPRHAPRLLAAMAAIALLAPGCGIQNWDGTVAGLTGNRAQNTAILDTSPEGLYAAGVEALQQRRFPAAVDLFDRVEREHPYSAWATNAKLMGAYAEYQRNRYPEAIGSLDRFIQLHPAHRDIAYAYYLRALSHYEQIADSQRDQRTTELAIIALQDVVNRFPETAYARDARLKIDLGRDHLAGKEMNIGRFYQRQRLYAAAINRYRRVVEEYQTTNHVPEALHRLTESYLALGLTEEARRTASVLGYNFPGNAWYQDSYALLVAGAEPAPEDRPGFFRRTWNWLF